MTTETKTDRRLKIAKRIAKLVVLNSVSATVSMAAVQNVNVNTKVQKVQLAVGAYALGSAAADAAWKAVEKDINAIRDAFNNAKESEEDVVVITDVE